MSTRRSSQLTIGYSSDWLKQSAWDAPLTNVQVDRAFPATSRNYLDLDETIENVMDCTGEDFLFELVTAEFARLNIDFDVDPELLAGIAAFGYGVAASPSAGTSEVQTETITATGGTRTLTVRTGANDQTTTPLAFDADAATIQAALEALSNVGAGDIVVADVGVNRTYTFANDLGAQDVALISVNTFLLTGGTSAMSETTPGVGNSHAISRLSGYTLPLMTLYVGFRGSSEQPVIFKNVVVNSFRVRSASKEKVTCSVELIGSADLQQSVGYTIPQCTDPLPLRFGECVMSIGGIDYIAQDLGREFEYYFQNDVVPKFDGVGSYSTRHERATQRPSGFNMFVLGEPYDDTFNTAKARTTLPVFVRCGPEGRSITFTAPQGLVKLAPSPIRFGGDPAESEVAVVVLPRKVSGIGTTPTNVTAVTAFPNTYATSA